MSNSTQGQTPLRAYLYVRVSTDKQEDNTSLETQEKEGRAYAQEHGITVIGVKHDVDSAKIYRERKGLSEVREAYRNGQINAVIIWMFDRLSRTQAHQAILIEEMQYYHVELHCVKEQLDNSPLGEFMRSALAFVAEMEHQKIIDRTVTGKRNRAAIKGALIPGAKPTYGYRWEDDRPKEKTRYMVYEPEARTVRRMFALCREGVSIRKIAQTLQNEGVPPPRGVRWYEYTIRTMLHNTFYIGEARAYRYSIDYKRRQEGHGYTIRPYDEQISLPDGTVPPIVTVQEFEQVQAQLSLNKTESARHNINPEETLLRSGFVKCGYCGCNLAVQRQIASNKKYYYVQYHCWEKRRAVRGCRGVQTKASLLDAEVWRALEALTEHSEVIREAIDAALSQDAFSKEIAALHNSLRNWEEIRDQYQEDLGNPALRGNARTGVLELLSDAEDKLAAIRQELAIVEQGQVDFEKIRREYESIKAWLGEVKECREELPYERKRTFLRLLGVQVFLYQEGDQEHERYEIKLTLPTIAPLTGKQQDIEDTTPWY